MRRNLVRAAVLGVIVLTLAGCYVVQTPPPSPSGAIPPLPPHAMRHCQWTYGHGWGGWGWYSIC